jgi:ABC-type branched-subunit amino acid transport system ATPase component
MAATSTSAPLSTGEIVLEGRAADLLQDENLKRAYLGR